MNHSKNHLWSDACLNAGKILAILMKCPLLIVSPNESSKSIEPLDIVQATWIHSFPKDGCSILPLETFLENSERLLDTLRSNYLSLALKKPVSDFLNQCASIVYYHPALSDVINQLGIEDNMLLHFLQANVKDILEMINKHYHNDIAGSNEILAQLILPLIRDLLDKKMYENIQQTTLTPYMHQIIDFGLSLKKGVFPPKKPSDIGEKEDIKDISEDKVNEHQIPKDKSSENFVISKKKRKHKRRKIKPGISTEIKNNALLDEEDMNKAHSRPKTALERLNFLLAYCDCDAILETNKSIDKNSPLENESNLLKKPDEPLMLWLAKEAQMLKDQRQLERKNFVRLRMRTAITQIIQTNSINKQSNSLSLDEKNAHQLFIKAPFYLLNTQVRNTCVKKLIAQQYMNFSQVTAEIREEALFTLINETLIELIENRFSEEKKITNKDIPQIVKNTYWQEYLHKHHQHFHLGISEDLLELYENSQIRAALINKYQQAIDCAAQIDSEYEREGGILSIVDKLLPMMMLTSSNAQSLRKGYIHLYRKLRILEENEGYELRDDWQSLESIRLKLLNAYNPNPIYCAELFEDNQEEEENDDNINNSDKDFEKSKEENQSTMVKKKVHWKL